MLSNDTDVKDDASIDTGTDVSSTEETKAETVESAVFEAMKDDFLPAQEEADTDTAEEVADDTKEDETETEVEEDKPAADETEIDDSELKEKTQKRVRNLLAEKRDLEAKVQALEAERNQPHTVDEYVEAGYSETRAELEALKEDLRVQRETQAVAQLNTDMIQAGADVEKHFPVFDESSPEYDADFVKEVGESYRRQANVTLDPSNEYVVRADIPLYDFYKQAADWRARGQELGRKAGAQDSAKQFASTEQAPSARPAAKPADSDDPVNLLLQGLTRNLSA